MRAAGVSAAAGLVGGWRLVSFQLESESGERHDLYGAGTSGLLIYSDNGLMSAVLSLPGRPASFRIDQDQRMADLEEKVAAFDSFISYSGRYSVADDQVSHHVEHSLFPNLIGTEQIRNVSWDGGRLILSNPFVVHTGVSWTVHATWERA